MGFDEWIIIIIICAPVLSVFPQTSTEVSCVQTMVSIKYVWISKTCSSLTNFILKPKIEELNPNGDTGDSTRDYWYLFLPPFVLPLSLSTESKKM